LGSILGFLNSLARVLLDSKTLGKYNEKSKRRMARQERRYGKGRAGIDLLFNASHA
jgi:hypothetical protein